MSNINEITSSSDISSVGEEQLFAELTPEQAATVEGGALLVTRIFRPVGRPNRNDPFLQFGRRISRTFNDFNRGRIIRPLVSNFRVPTRLSIIDRNFGARNIRLASRVIRVPRPGQVVSGILRGGRYALSYLVVG